MPKSTLVYYKKEIMLGILFNTSLCLFYSIYILPDFDSYFYTRKIASIIFIALFILTILGIFTKILIFILVMKRKQSETLHELRLDLIKLFRTKVFYYNFKLGSITMIIYLVSLIQCITFEQLLSDTSFLCRALFLWCVGF